MANKVIGQYSAASTIDGATHFLLIQPGNSSTAYNSINRNTLLGVTGQPMDISTAQTVTNKVLGNTNSITVKDGSFTLQDDADTTKQAQFQLSGNTTGTTRIYSLPNATGTLADLATAQTLTNKTLTSPVITGGSITGSTITTDAIVGQSVATNGTVYGLSITSGKTSGANITANTITSTQLANASVTANKLATGATSATVATLETTTSTSYTDLATVTDTVTVTIGANGLALVIITADHYNSTSGQFDYTSFVASGANTIAATDGNALMQKNAQASDEKTNSWSKLFTGLTPGSTTFKMKYKVNANTGSFANRSISVIPL
ncbi:hypothetical protein UFOVP253_41 [uncultured Caudovirales phage]|uniref:Uncharacterized protein n=1 Tax=uncultured Caudovirales phage TaxID=2100421 RepID=A0A6J5LI10_9CAUD|nr:hypothetical protein UFOVP253_41 [uncultured Caudovirales phage]